MSVICSLIVPAFNESKRIRPCIEAICKHYAGEEREMEIVLVDDGSSDNTVQLALETFSRYRSPGMPLHLKIVRTEFNNGKGWAVAQGIRVARGRTVAFMDADLSAPMEDVDKVMNALETASMAVGIRNHIHPGMQVGNPGQRPWIGNVFAWLAGWICPTGIRDTQCGLKAYRRGLALELVARQRIWGFCFDVEHLFLARNLGYTVAAIPVRWTHQPHSTVRVWRDGPRMLLDLFRIRWFAPAHQGHVTEFRVSRHGF